jgi:GNAT superfamily N-acetyltransferase
VTIREATDDDVGALAAIQSAASSLAYAGIFDAADPPPTLQRIALRWASLMARPRSWVGLLEVDGEPVATVAVQPSPDADLDGSEVAEACSFYVHPRCWGERRGRALFERALVEADALGFTTVRLWVLEANVRARRIYAERHWVADGATREAAPGVREVRYRAPDPAADAATSARSVTGIDLDDLYDAETAARIDAARPSEPPRPVGRVRRKGVAGAMAAAMMMGLREVFDPPTRSEIEQVDPWEGGGANPWVKVHLDPDPRQTIAEVRDP